MNKQKLVLLLPLILLVAALIPAVVQANGGTTVTLSPTADSYVCGNNGDAAKGANYGTAEFIEVHHAYQMYAFLQFDLSTIPTGSTIVSANLKLYSQLGADDIAIAAYRVDGSWDETHITWNNMPSIESTSSASGNPPSSNPWTFDLKSDVQSFVSGSTANHGWCLIIGGGQTTFRTFASKEYTGDPNTRPVLEITYGPSLPIPEYAFGALLAMVGCFAAFIIIKKPHLNLRIR